MIGEKLPSLGHEAIAWEPYVSPSTTEQPTPQGIGWYGQLVEKPFYCAKTKGLDLFQGEVEEIILTKEGQERIRLVYSDGDRESLQVGNILPWWVGSDGRTWLEAHSPISTAGLSRMEHIMYTMLASKDGPWRSEALGLLQYDSRFQDFASHQPLRVVDAPKIADSSGPRWTPEEAKRSHMVNQADMTKLGIPCAEDEQELARPPRKKPRSNLLLRKVLALKVGESRQEVSDSFDNDGLEGRPTPEEE